MLTKPLNILGNTVKCYTNINTHIKKYYDILYTNQQKQLKILRNTMKCYTNINKTIEHIKTIYEILYEYQQNHEKV